MNELFTCKNCSVSVQERKSKNDKDYQVLVLTIGGKDYWFFKNKATENTINNILVDNLKK